MLLVYSKEQYGAGELVLLATLYCFNADFVLVIYIKRLQCWGKRSSNTNCVIMRWSRRIHSSL